MNADKRTNRCRRCLLHSGSRWQGTSLDQWHRWNTARLCGSRIIKRQDREPERCGMDCRYHSWCWSGHLSCRIRSWPLEHRRPRCFRRALTFRIFPSTGIYWHDCCQHTTNRASLDAELPMEYGNHPSWLFAEDGNLVPTRYWRYAF